MWKRILYLSRLLSCKPLLYSSPRRASIDEQVLCSRTTPVSLLSRFFRSFLLFVKRGTTQLKALVHYNLLIWFLSSSFFFLPPVLPLMGNKTVAHSPEHILRAVFSVHWTVPHACCWAVEILKEQRLRSVHKRPFRRTSFWSEGLDPVGGVGGGGDGEVKRRCRARDCSSAMFPRIV